MDKKIMVTGANGLLGQFLVQWLLYKGYTVAATGKGESRLPFDGQPAYSWHTLDFTDPDAVPALVAHVAPEVIVHSGAHTQVDLCELDHEACRKTNVEGTRLLLQAAAACNARFVFLSTDFVFDGANGPYNETATPNPISMYGHSKLAGEQMVQQSGLSWSIVRTILVYGTALVGTRSNIITWTKENLEAGKPIKVVSDQWRTPTYVGDLAKGVELVIRHEAQGLFHISGKDFLTPYDMALQTARLLKLDETLMTKVDAATFTQPGKRPPRTGFVIDKAIDELGYAPVSFEEGIRLTLGL